MSYARCRHAESASDPRPMRVRSFREGDVQVIAIAETFDGALMKEVERELVAAEGTETQVIVLDMRAVPVITGENLRVVAITVGKPPAGDSPG